MRAQACKNGGSCAALSPVGAGGHRHLQLQQGHFRCACTTGFSGAHCQIVASSWHLTNAHGPTGTAVSVNQYSLLWDRTTNGGWNRCWNGRVYLVPCHYGAASSRASMMRAKALGFDVLRFGASGFWPADHALFVNTTTRPLYLAALDSVFEDARALGVKLIPSLQWNHWAFVDTVCHESLGADMMRDPASCSHRGVQEFVSTVVARYSGPSARYRGVVYAWELGNELNLLMDANLTNRAILCSPKRGTPARRTSADNFSMSDMVSFQETVVGWVRQAAHPHPVLISSGHSVPRAKAYSMMQSYHAVHRHLTNDTEAQLQAVLERCNTGLDLISLHIYAHAANYRFGQPPEYLLGIAAKAASAVKKAVYLGEFGVKLSDGRRNRTSPLFNFSRDMLSAAAQASVLLATYWTWEDRQQRFTHALWPPNATAQNDEHTIQVLQAANARTR